MSNYFFGLDFGTSNSVLGYPSNGEVEIIDIDRSGLQKKIMRSVLYFDERNRVFTGEEAIRRYLEDDAIGRYMQSLKKFLPSPMSISTEIDRKMYRLDDLIAILLRRIREVGQRETGKDVARVVLGRPVFFSGNESEDKLAQKRLLSAAKKAGFQEIHFELEPIAAALAFESTLSEGEEKVVLVGDFGGGTSDFAVVKISGDGWKKKLDRWSDVLAVAGTNIGGDNFDSRIMEMKITPYFGRDAKISSPMRSGETFTVPRWIIAQLCAWHMIPFLKSKKNREAIRNQTRLAVTEDRHLLENLEVLVDYNYGFRLFQAIEKAKCELSEKEKSRIVFSQYQLEIDELITLQEFENFVGSDIEKLEECVNEAVSQSGISKPEIDAVFLTGGSSQIPLIRKFFIDQFGPEKIREANAFTSVAYGLSLTARKYQ